MPLPERDDVATMQPPRQFPWTGTLGIGLGSIANSADGSGTIGWAPLARAAIASMRVIHFTGSPSPPRAAVFVVGISLLHLASSASLCRAQHPPSSEWQRYDSARGGFSVEVPNTPEIREKKTWFPMASFVSYAYRSWVTDGAFGMNHTDLPGAILMLAGKSKIIRSTRAGLCEDVAGTEVSFRETSFHDMPAHELIYDMPAQDGFPPRRGKAYIFFRDRRLFVFWAELGAAHPESETARFFGSVRIQPR